MPEGWKAGMMLDIVKLVALLCAPVMTVMSRIGDSPDDRRDGARRSELYRLWQMSQGQQL
jgi:hypothetical protein